jgi:preprotein translocase subunit YajC
MISQMITLQTAAAGQANGYSSILMIVALIAIFYFMMIRPQQKRQKKINEFRKSLTKGDPVVTQGGLLGKIAEVRDDSFVVDLGGNVKVRVAKECVYPSAAEANVTAQAEGKNQ